MPTQCEEDRLRALRELRLLDTPPSEAFDRITRLASRLFNLPISAISLTDKDRQWFKSRVGVDEPQLPRHKAPCAQVTSTRDIVVLPDILKEDFYRDSDLAKAGMRFYAGAPLVTRDGFGLGSMCVVGPEPRTVTEGELTALKDLAAMVMAQIELRHAFGRIDPVSGLPNRNQLIEDLDDLARDHPGEDRTAVLIDIADRRQLAEAQRVLGPFFVDDLMRAAKIAIQAAQGEDGVLYHVGKTDFATVLNEPDEHTLHRTLAVIQSSLRGFVESSGIPVAIDATMGIVPFRLGETTGLDVLRKAYGAALDAREAELGVELHSPLKDKEHQRRFSLLIGIREALAAQDQLSLVYQPRIDVKTGSCVSAEALLRWHHPSLGSISPSEFIPLVEQTALARPVTEWVLETALAQAAVWKSAGSEFGISINIFAANLEEEDFAWRLREALDRHGVSPSMVELEFTEGALIRRRARVLEQLIDIRAVGVTCAIDDFGTGYNSFAYLQNIPADVTKIDRPFMGGLERERDQKLVRAMITMSHELEYRAEGVETQEAYEFLAKSGCDEIQGYLISRPLSPSGFGKWLSARARSGGQERAA